MVRGYGVLGACLFMAFAVAAGEKPLLSEPGHPEILVDVTAMKEVVARDEAGRERLELREITTTGPGDTLVYRIAYTNKGTSPAHDAKVIDPIPAGTVLLPQSWQSQGADFSVSVDGGKTWESYPVRSSVRQDDGKVVTRDVDMSSYTHVRWTTREPLAPGATRSAIFKVKVR